MFKEDYRNEMDSLAVDEAFRRQTIQLMKEKAAKSENTAKPARNTVYFRKKKSMRTAASVAVMMISFVRAYFIQDYFTGADSSAMDTASQQPNQEAVTVKAETPDSEYDALPMPVNKEITRIYTIGDSKAVYSAGSKKNAVVFNTETSGSYGFEGYLLYDISQLATNNPFDENAVFDVLPVYEFSSMTNEDIKEEFDRLLQNTGMTEDDINYTEFQWVEIIDDGRR